MGWLKTVSDFLIINNRNLIIMLWWFLISFCLVLVFKSPENDFLALLNLAYPSTVVNTDELFSSKVFVKNPQDIKKVNILRSCILSLISITQQGTSEEFCFLYKITRSSAGCYTPNRTRTRKHICVKCQFPAIKNGTCKGNKALVKVPVRIFFVLCTHTCTIVLFSPIGSLHCISILHHYINF